MGTFVREFKYKIYATFFTSNNFLASPKWDLTMQAIQILCDLLPENCQYLFCCSPHGDIIMSEKLLCRSNFFIYLSSIDITFVKNLQKMYLSSNFNLSKYKSKHTNMQMSSRYRKNTLQGDLNEGKYLIKSFGYIVSLKH